MKTKPIAEGINIPQLKRIIVIHGDKVVMEPTLEQALRAALGAPEAEKQTIAAPVQNTEWIRAKEEFAKAQQALEHGSWQDFGNAMEALKKILVTQPQKVIK